MLWKERHILHGQTRSSLPDEEAIVLPGGLGTTREVGHGSPDTCLTLGFIGTSRCSLAPDPPQELPTFLQDPLLSSYPWLHFPLGLGGWTSPLDSQGVPSHLSVLEDSDKFQDGLSRTVFVFMFSKLVYIFPLRVLTCMHHNCLFHRKITF